MCQLREYLQINYNILINQSSNKIVLPYKVYHVELARQFLTIFLQPSLSSIAFLFH